MSGNHQNQNSHPIRGFFWLLKQIFFLACVLIAGFAVIGYASGWVKIDHNKQQEKATIEIDTGQAKKSVEKSVEKGKELIESGGETIDELTTTDGNPTDAQEGEVAVTEKLQPKNAGGGGLKRKFRTHPR